VSTVEVRTDGAVWTIVLNRPAQRNAIDADLQHQLVTALSAFDAEPGARAAVLTGSDPAFCAGMDLKVLGRGGLQFSQQTDFAQTMRVLHKPVIGAINGAAIAGGLELALACDFLIASDRAWFADTHADVSVLPGGGLTVRLAEAVGVRRARQISLTGEYVDAMRALLDGLVTEVVPHDELLTRAGELARAVASRSDWIVRELRLAYDRTLNLSTASPTDLSRGARPE
jgi:enoyl-CoA hydratase